MELTIQVNPLTRSARFREVSYLAAGDTCSVVLSGVRGASVASLWLALYRNATSESPVAACSSFAEVPGHPSLASGELRLDTAEMAAWFETADAGADSQNTVQQNFSQAELTVRTDGWLVVADASRTWVACRVPVLLRPGAGIAGVVDPASLSALVEGLVAAAVVAPLSGKADKVSGAVAGNLASLDSAGNLADSGTKPSDFATATRVAALETSKADASQVYTKTEVEDLLQALKTGSRQIVQNLPASGESMKIYMVSKSSAQTNNAYDEYIWTAAGAWEKIGDTEIDLSGYVRKEAGKGLFSGSYNDLTGKPTIPTVPQISTDISADAMSDAKTASPKAVKMFVDSEAPSVVADAMVYKFSDWVLTYTESGEPVDAEALHLTIEWQDEVPGIVYAGWVPKFYGTTAGFPKGNATSTSLSWTTSEGEFDAGITATRTKTDPSIRVPKEGLAGDVQASLGRADTALQPLSIADPSVVTAAGKAADALAVKNALALKADASVIGYDFVHPEGSQSADAARWSVVPDTCYGFPVGVKWTSEGWVVYALNEDSNYFSSPKGSIDDQYITWSGMADAAIDFAATRLSSTAEYNLSCRAVNLVSVSGESQLVLPAPIPGKVRDFVVSVAMSGSSPSVSISSTDAGGKAVTLSPTPTIADGSLLRFTEVSQSVEGGVVSGATFKVIDLAATYLTSHQDISGKADKSEMSITPGTGQNADKTTIQLKNGTSATVLSAHQDVSGKYAKPSGGIPKTDLASDVQTSLGKADTALQSHQSLANQPASNIGSGTLDPARLPVATTSAFGAVKPDGTTITIIDGVLSAQGGGGGGGGGYGTVAIDAVDAESGSIPCGIVYNNNRYEPILYSSKEGKYLVIPQTLVVKAGDEVSVDYNGERGDCDVWHNGVKLTGNAKPSTITMADGDQWLIRFGWCLAPDTLITMANGSMKMVKDIRLGDVVLTPFGPDKVVEASQGEGSAIDEWTFGNGVVVKTIGRHRFFNVELGEPMYLEAWNMGEHALDADGRKIELVKHERKEEPSPHATLFTEKWNLYYANGLLAGNRRSVGYEEIKS